MFETNEGIGVIRGNVPVGASMREIPHPPRESEIIVRPIEVGVCGTDLNILAGSEGAPPLGENFLVLGHEVLGRVEGGLGAGDLANRLVGCLVRHPDPQPCEQCAKGRSDLCSNNGWTENGIRGSHGFLCRRFATTESRLIVLPDSLDKIGVLLEPMSIVCKAIETLGAIDKSRGVAMRSDSCLVVGCGAIGLLAAAFLRLSGAKVTVVDPSPVGSKRERLVSELGCAYESGIIDESVTSRNYLAANRVVIDAAGVPRLFPTQSRYGCGNSSTVCIGMPIVSSEGVDYSNLLSGVVQNNRLFVGIVNSARQHFERARQALIEIDMRWPGLLGQSITRYKWQDFDRAFAGPDEDTVKRVIVVG